MLYLIHLDHALHELNVVLVYCPLTAVRCGCTILERKDQFGLILNHPLTVIFWSARWPRFPHDIYTLGKRFIVVPYFMVSKIRLDFTKATYDLSC